MPAPKTKEKYDEWVKKMIVARIGTRRSEETRLKMSKNNAKFWKGKKKTNEQKEKISNSLKGRKISKESIEKIRGKLLGRKKPEMVGNKNPKWKGGEKIKKCVVCGKEFYCRPCLKERVKYCSRVCFGKDQTGEKSILWKGGKSFEPYTTDWTLILKKSIRVRDKYVCNICHKKNSITVHHIDYDKKNCNPDNLITLCNSCHTKTNFDRDYWIKYFKQIQLDDTRRATDQD